MMFAVSSFSSCLSFSYGTYWWDHQYVRSGVMSVRLVLLKNHRFEYRLRGDWIEYISSGTYHKSGNYLILNSDYDINSLPLEINTTKIKNTELNKVRVNIENDFQEYEKVVYSLIINDGNEYFFRNDSSKIIDDTVVVRGVIDKLQVKANFDKFYEPIIQNVDGQERKYYRVRGLNECVYSEVKYPEKGNFHELKFSLDYTMVNYRTISQDTFVIINRNSILRLSSGSIYVNK